MTPNNPFQDLVHSRKFWLAILDALLSTITTVLGWIFAPEQATAIMALVITWQPVIIAVILSYTVQNVAGIKAAGDVNTAKVQGDNDLASAAEYRKVEVIKADASVEVAKAAAVTK